MFVIIVEFGSDGHSMRMLLIMNFSVNTITDAREAFCCVTLIIVFEIGFKVNNMHLISILTLKCKVDFMLHTFEITICEFSRNICVTDQSEVVVKNVGVGFIAVRSEKSLIQNADVWFIFSF